MLLTYFRWHYGRGFQSLLRIVGNFLAFSAHLFSVRELARSLFLPWKQVIVPSRGGLFNQEAFAALWANVLSRILGAFARAAFIFFGLLFMAMVGTAGIAVTALWLLGPAGPIGLLLFGAKVL